MVLNTLRVSYALAVHGEEEEKRVIKVLRSKKTILGTETSTFEKSVAKLFKKKFGIMVNSGSSANLLAFELLNLPVNSEVITPLLTFSTCISPMILKRLTPAFVDVEEGTYVVNVKQIEMLITKKTKAIFIPLLLGNVPDMEKLRSIAKKYHLFLVEDSCDTLGATFKGKPTGTYTDITTTSFYGSHIITAGGGGGMIIVNNVKWRDKAKVLRGWGRGSALINESEDIVKRYRTNIGNIPYDAKFIFSELGYNILPLEMSAAFGNAQLQKLGRFRKTRERNFAQLHNFFAQHDDFFILPKQHPKVSTHWLGFPLTIKKDAPFDRLTLVTHLENNNIQTRPIFAGNILKHPGFQKINHKTIRQGYPMTEHVMERGLVIGCHQGLEQKHLDVIKDVVTNFLRRHR